MAPEVAMGKPYNGAADVYGERRVDFRCVLLLLLLLLLLFVLLSGLDGVRRRRA